MPGAECNVNEMCMNRLIYFPFFFVFFLNQELDKNGAIEGAEEDI